MPVLGPKSLRRLRLANLFFQAVLILTMLGGANYLSQSYAWRFDLTRNRLYSLGAETLSYLRQVEEPITAIVTLRENTTDPDLAQAYRDATGLLREYAYHLNRRQPGLFQMRKLDVFQHRLEAEQLGIDQPYVILFRSGDRERAVTVDELYRMENRERTGFQGERAFSSAILEVTQSHRPRLYFLTGHGELRPDDVDSTRGLSMLAGELRQRNFEIVTLDLVREGQIPADADLLISAGPQTPYLPEEEEMLRKYLNERAGRLFLLLAPGRAHGLDRLLRDWGVLADDVLVLDTSPDFMPDSGTMLLRYFSEHPVTRVLISNRIPVAMGMARSVRPDPARQPDPGLRVTPLLRTTETAWGEAGYHLRTAPRFDEGVDLPGPLFLATVSERVAAANLPFSVRGSRLLVIGTDDFVTNNRINLLGNLTFFRNAVNWALDRDTSLNIPPRRLDKFQLALSRDDLDRLRLLLLFFLPGGAATLGLLVYWTRRS